MLPLLIASNADAANYAIEARGDAMGGVGVVSANYLTAPFYNPALVAVYRRNDDAGMILPSVGLSYDDQDKLVKSFSDIADLINTNNLALDSELEAALNAIDGKVINADVGGVVAFGIPNRYISANIFGKAYSEIYAAPRIENNCPNSSPGSSQCTFERAQNSGINAVSIGVTEVGISLAKYQHFLGQHMAIGITPKLQRIYTFLFVTDFENYELKDLLDNGTGETTFNIDAGAVWFYGPYRFGIAASNLISRDIKTKEISSVQYDYQIRPQVTLGAGLVADYATLSVDYDLNVDRRFSNFADDTQMLRVGGEVDIMRQLKLRVGYKKNLAYSGREGTITAGIGLSPLNIVQLDIGASYTNENAMGAFVNFLASY